MPAIPHVLKVGTRGASELTGEQAVALNRAAVSSPDLADALLAGGRHRIGRLVEVYLARLADDGQLAIDDPADAFTLLYGLAVRDIQIRVLLGEDQPPPPVLAAQAAQAVDLFFQLASGH